MTPEEEIVQLKETIREAHETIQSLRLLIREGNALKVELSEAIHRDIEKILQQAVEKDLAEFQDLVTKHINLSVQNINSEFDKLRNMLMHGNAQGKGPSLFDLGGGQQ